MPIKVNVAIPEDIQTRLGDRVSQIPLKVSEWILQRTRETWDASTDPFGNAWIPLAPSTLAGRRKRNVVGIRPLIDTGVMRSSLKMVKGADFISITVDDPSPHHQYGTRRGVPARPIFPEGPNLSDSWSRDLTGMLEDRIKVLIGE